jgi:DNA-binding MarR family transcriptional regulator
MFFSQFTPAKFERIIDNGVFLAPFFSFKIETSMTDKSPDVASDKALHDADRGSADFVQPYDLSTFLPFRLARLQANLNAQASDLLRRHGALPMAHWRVLLVINKQLASTQKEIVKAAGFDKGQVSRIVDRLVAEGLLVSKNHVGDRRVHKLKLTDAARQLLGRLEPLMLKRNDHLTSVFDETEMTQLFEFLDRLDKVSGKLDL